MTLIQPLHGCIDRQEHEGDEDIGHADDHGEIRIKKFEGFRRQADPDQGLIEKAGGAQDQHPGKEPDDQADEKWQGDEKDAQVSHCRSHAGNPEGCRIADGQRCEDRQRCQFERAQEDPEIDRIKFFIFGVSPSQNAAIIEIEKFPFDPAIYSRHQEAVNDHDEQRAEEEKEQECGWGTQERQQAQSFAGLKLHATVSGIRWRLSSAAFSVMASPICGVPDPVRSKICKAPKACVSTFTCQSLPS